MSSFDSVKGPSTMLRFEPRYPTRQPLEVGCNPVASRSTPAFANSSWYVVIAANISCLGMAPASVSFVALTMIMNRMFFLPFGLSLAAKAWPCSQYSLLGRRIGAGKFDICPNYFYLSLRHCEYRL